MMWRDRILAWGVVVAASLLPGCSGHPIKQLMPDPDEEPLNVKPIPRAAGSNYDNRILAAQPKPVPLQTGPFTPPYPQGTMGSVQSTQPAPGAVVPPPTPRGPAGGTELQAVVHAEVSPAPVQQRPPEPPLLAALRCFREGRNDEARKHLQTFDPSTRALLDRLLLLAVRVSKVNLDKVPPRELSAFVEQFDALAQIIRPRAGLQITEVRFCRRIHRFGDYDPLPADHAFQAGTGDRPGDFVQVYVELRNFTCCKHGPFYETALASSVTIRDANQQIVCHVGRPAQVDRLLSRRLDCFLNCHFYVPANLPPGEYRLAIKVEDVTGLPAEARTPAQHVAEQVVPFRVSSPAYAGATWGNTEGAGSE